MNWNPELWPRGALLRLLGRLCAWIRPFLIWKTALILTGWGVGTILLREIFGVLQFGMPGTWAGEIATILNHLGSPELQAVIVAIVLGVFAARWIWKADSLARTVLVIGCMLTGVGVLHAIVYWSWRVHLGGLSGTISARGYPVSLKDIPSDAPGMRYAGGVVRDWASKCDRPGSDRIRPSVKLSQLCVWLDGSGDLDPVTGKNRRHVWPADARAVIGVMKRNHAGLFAGLRDRIEPAVRASDLWSRWERPGPTWSGSLYSETPGLIDSMTVARAFRVLAAEAVMSNRVHEAWEFIRAQLRLSKLVGTCRSTLGQMMSRSAASSAARTVEIILANRPGSEVPLDIRVGLNERSRSRYLAIGAAESFAWSMDLMEAPRREEPGWRFWITAPFLYSLLAEEMHDALRATRTSTGWPQFPARYEDRDFDSRTRMRLALAVTLVHDYYRIHRGWPETLESVVRAGSATPWIEDPYAGRTLNYELAKAGKGWRVWSVGSRNDGRDSEKAPLEARYPLAQAPISKISADTIVP